MKRKQAYCLLATWFAMIVVWSIYFLAYYPGILSYDFFVQIFQYMHGWITTHHPVLHTLLVGNLWEMGIVRLGNANLGIAIYCILQILSLSLVFLRGAYVLLKLEVSKVRYILYCVFAALFPINGFMVCTVTKDLFFSAAVLLLVVTIVEIYFCASDKITVTTYILLALGIIGTCIFRNNGKYPLAILLVAVFFLLRKNKANCDKYLRIFKFSVLVFVLSLLMLMLVKVVGNYGTGNPREMLSVPIQQMARIATNNHETMDAELLAYIESCIGTDYATKYEPAISDPVKDQFDIYVLINDPFTFVKNYFKMLIAYPKDFFAAFLELNAGYLFFWDESHVWINGNYGYIQTYANEVSLESAGIILDSKLPKLFAYFQNWTMNNLYLQNILWRVLFAPTWYFYVAIGYLVYALKKKNKGHLMLAIFALAYFVTLLLGPGVMLRYVYPMMLSEIFLMLCLKETRHKHT